MTWICGFFAAHERRYAHRHLYPLSEGAVVAPDLEVAVKEDEKEEPLAKEEEQEDEVKTED